MSYSLILDQLHQYGDAERAHFSERMIPQTQFNPRQDSLLGCSVPNVRKVGKIYKDVAFDDVSQLLASGIHEAKLCGLIILKFKVDDAIKAEHDKTIEEILAYYISIIDFVDHWDLVDESAPRVLGRILLHKLQQHGDPTNIKEFDVKGNGLDILQELARKKSIWPRRITIIAMFPFLKVHALDLALSICDFHIQEHEHYIQKAVGWILREVGKQDMKLLNEFLIFNIDEIGSICLSYALEKHSDAEKKMIRGKRAKKRVDNRLPQDVESGDFRDYARQSNGNASGTPTRRKSQRARDRDIDRRMSEERRNGNAKQ